MKYNQLSLSAHRRKNRVGRGIAAGQGKTAGRGTKGYGSRTGSSRRPGFEGGQNPIMQRLPKMRGFRSNKAANETVQVSDLAKLKGSVDNFSLFEAGLTSSPYVSVKLIGNDPLTTKHSVRVQSASRAAIESVTKAGGSFVATDRVAEVAKSKPEA